MNANSVIRKLQRISLAIFIVGLVVFFVASSLYFSHNQEWALGLLTYATVTWFISLLIWLILKCAE